MTVQAQVLALLRDVTRSSVVLFITHDMGIGGEVADRVAVMYAGAVVESGAVADVYLGRIVERGRTDALFANPRHPYTQVLLASVPRPRVDRSRTARPLDRPSGCVFSTRCQLATDRCRTEVPVLRRSVTRCAWRRATTPRPRRWQRERGHRAGRGRGADRGGRAGAGDGAGR